MMDDTQTPKVDLVFKDRYTAEEIAAHPENIYVFGDNHMRRGTGGQAAACRKFQMVNAVGISTKRAPETATTAYCDGSLYDLQHLMNDLRHLAEFVHQRRFYNSDPPLKQIVWPADGIGTGFAELNKRWPPALKLIDAFRECLEHMIELENSR